MKVMGGALAYEDWLVDAIMNHNDKKGMKELPSPQHTLGVKLIKAGYATFVIIMSC